MVSESKAPCRVMYHMEWLEWREQCCKTGWMRHFTLTGNGLKNFGEDLIKDWYDGCELTLNRITVSALLSLGNKGVRDESRDKRKLWKSSSEMAVSHLTKAVRRNYMDISKLSHEWGQAFISLHPASTLNWCLSLWITFLAVSRKWKTHHEFCIFITRSSCLD